MKRTHIKDIYKNVGKEVKLMGFVSIRRDHGKLIFFDLRDTGGDVQVVVLPDRGEAMNVANKLRPEWVVEIKGMVNERPEKMINRDSDNGKYEVSASAIAVLSEALTPLFDIHSDGYEINEEVRMKYRYLDLRRPRLVNNIRQRSKIVNFIRNYLIKKDFIEIETPILTKSTPEGARDYVVPSRLYKGKFYALPQSPQQYKQLLMVSGIEKYFQIARCLRDEDTRGDRQPEHTQLDIEMSFIEQDDILATIEDLYTKLVKELFPEKKITKSPWPRISYDESIKKYNTDRPDMRVNKDDENELAFTWVLDFPLFESELENGHLTPSHHMFTAPKTEDIEKLDSSPEKVRSYQHDLSLNGNEIAGGSIRINDPKIQSKIFDLIGFDKKNKDYFGHLIKAFSFGVPPHGGVASGLDRFISILLNEPNIREVIAFPKTGEGQDLLMDAPAVISEKQLKELGIKLTEN